MGEEVEAEAGGEPNGGCEEAAAAEGKGEDEEEAETEPRGAAATAPPPPPSTAAVMGGSDRGGREWGNEESEREGERVAVSWTRAVLQCTAEAEWMGKTSSYDMADRATIDR